MKITFEGKTIGELLDQMQETLREFQIPAVALKATAPKNSVPSDIVPPVIVPVDKPVANPVEKPKRPRSQKQLENDERLRVAALERIAAKNAAKTPKPQKAPAAAPKAVDMPPPPPPASAESLGLAPDEVVKVRQRTIEDLQTAYANGHQAEVFELLSRFGNGAKSFRELPPESFVPIREAIDNGALT